MNLPEDSKIAVIGLGYVGGHGCVGSLAVASSRNFAERGFDSVVGAVAPGVRFDLRNQWAEAELPAGVRRLSI